MGKNVNIMTPPIYIGGLPEAAEEPSQTMPSNFVGCLQEIYVYDVSLSIFRVIHSKCRASFRDFQ